MKVLFVTWELDPFLKLGGLGDVARSLPGALKENGVDIRIVIPFYKVLKLGKIKRTRVGELVVKYAGKDEKVEIISVIHPFSKVSVYLLANKKYLDIAKTQETFAFFDKAVVEVVQQNSFFFMPDIIHCNDHHTGLIPLLVRERKLPVKTFFTIHNLSYQGVGSTEILDKLGIDINKCKVLKWEIESRRLNFLMEGIIHADIVTTVSPTYAKEIMKEEYGMGLEEILRGKEGRVFGILNGIDINFDKLVYDKALKYPYGGAKGKMEEKGVGKIYPWEEGKRLNKLFLQRKLGLKVGADIPLLSFIGRFVSNQKGIDILHKMIRRKGVEKYELVILGSGDPNWEERYQWLCTFYPKSVSCNFKFDEALARQIHAASDFILIPSRFEPCGLTQMFAMFFGAIPIARRTGGLADSIQDGVNGFLFDKSTSESLEKAVNKALDIWRHDKTHYKMMVAAALATDFSWDKSAEEYVRLYERVIRGGDT